MVLNDAALNVLNGPLLANLTTINPDGSTQVSIVWVKAEGDDITLAHLGTGQKLRNIGRDPRVTVTVISGHRNETGLDEYLVVHGRAHLVDGGAPALLQELAHTYLGPDVDFPPMPDPPKGTIVHITPHRVGGIGPWTD